MEDIHAFYIYHNHGQSGPHTIKAVVDYLNKHQVRSTIKLFTPGWPSWKPVSELPELQELCAKRRLYSKAEFTSLSRDWNQALQSSTHSPKYTSIAARRLSHWDTLHAYRPSPYTPLTLRQKMIISAFALCSGALILWLLA